MKKKSLVILSMLLSVIMLMSGCGGQNKKSSQVNSIFNSEGFPIMKEKTVLNLMGAKSAIQGSWEQLKFFKDLEQKTNISFNFKTPPNENYAEMKNLAFASNEVPDVFFNGQLSPDDEVKYGSQGILIPLEDLIDKYAPNIKKMLSENPNIRRSITTPDGHIYALPRVLDGSREKVLKLWLNEKWMNNLNITQIPSNVDELYQLLKDFKEKDPNQNGKQDEIPLSTSNMFAVREIFLSYFGRLTSGFEVHDKKVSFTPITENYKQYLIFMNKLFAEGLLDNECYIQTPQQWTAKAKENRVGLSFHAAPFLIYNVEKEENNEKYKALPPLTSSLSQQAIYPLYTNGILRGTFAITSKNKNPEASIRWVDYLYSEEGSKFVHTAGEWKWTDDSKTKWKLDIPEGEAVEQFRGGKLTPDVGGQVPTWKRKDLIYSEFSPVNDYLNNVSDEIMTKAVQGFPQVYYIDSEQKTLSQYMADISSYVGQSESKFITGVTPFSEWDNYIKTIKDMKIVECVKVTQDAYDRYISIK